MATIHVEQGGLRSILLDGKSFVLNLNVTNYQMF